jgi:TRAP-type C4-dicarboxylate transport system substrate-binding protein
MKHSKFLAILIVAAVSMLSANVLYAQEQIVLKFADQWPLTHGGSRLGSQPFIQKIEERSKGRVKIRYFPSEQLAKASGLFDATRNKVTDLGYVGLVYTAEKAPLTTLVELPGMHQDANKGARAMHKLIMNDLLQSEYLRYGVRPLFAVITPQYQMMFSKRSGKTVINDISDIKGMKIRVSGDTGQLVVKALGGIPVTVASSDIYLALERGTIDGNIHSPSGARSYKLDPVLSSTTTNASLGSVAFAVIVNESVWQQLPQDVRNLITEVSNEVEGIMSAGFQNEQDEATEALRAAGVIPFQLSPKVQEQFKERLSQVEADFVAKRKSRGLPVVETLATYRRYLSEQ